MDENRPSPEEMLERAAREDERARRGRLKIFFGASPGVGKTYALLEEARRKKNEGVDVVVGWVETHGRRETEALVVGLERIPVRRVEYRGLQLSEFDLDAALARRPRLILLDELAHTNAAGSRHARRWQDVEELLAAGIDVYTTLNVQHVESLNDVVASVTGVVVRETVPDSILDSADEIELIDLSPEDLLQRLREGKVYLPVQAERAMQSFFRKGNLIALRELALRRTAERVDAQGLEWRREHGVTQPWGTSDRVLVAVGPAPSSASVVRVAYRQARRLRAPWIALSVETPAFERLGPAERERVATHLAMAQRLGAETLVVRGERASEEILAVARERSVTQIVIGKPLGLRWRELLRLGLVAELLRGSGPIDVLVTKGEEDLEHRPVLRAARRPVRRADYQLALGMVVASTVACWATRSFFSIAEQVMIYLLGVLIVASRAPRWPSLLHAIVAVAALDFFFVPPPFTFAVSDLKHFLTFAVMLVVGLTVSTLTVRLREQAEAARERERRTASLYAMGRQFVVETGVAEIASVAVQHVRDLLGTDAVVLLADRTGELVPCGGGSADVGKSDFDMAVARWVFTNGRLAGHGTDTLPASEALFIPLVGTTGHLGAFGIALGRRGAPPTPAQWQIVETFVAQTALALERALLVEQTARARVEIERERTRSSLLSAVSHDLRTPLSSITGAADVLLENGSRLDGAATRDLLCTIREESERLSRLVGDLLDLTRIESGALSVTKEWYPLEEVIDSALERLAGRLEGREITRDFPEEVIVAPVDPILLEQVFFNLFENTAKYSPPESALEIRLAGDPERAVVEVSDRGPGLPPGEEERVFERFYRTADSQRAAGTGLGLTVSRAILKAHGGSISAENRAGGGLTFRIEIPIAGTPPRPPAAELAARA